MKLLNKVIKAIGFAMVNIYSFVQCYLESLIFTAPVLCVVLSIVNLITKGLPVFVVKHFCLLYVLSCIPLAVVFFILVLKGVVNKFNNKESK